MDFLTPPPGLVILAAVTTRAAGMESELLDSYKRELLPVHAGQFAVVCGEALWAVRGTLDEALDFVAALFAEGRLAAHERILISEISERPAVRLCAEPDVLSLMSLEPK
jgi:hypothetical protein